MSDTTTGEIEIGTQVTTPHGVGIVTWVKVGGDEFRVLVYDGDPFGPRRTVRVDRDHITFWPPRKRESADDRSGS